MRKARPLLNLFDITLQLNRFPIHQARKELARIQSLDQANKAAFIESQKKSIVEHHLQHNTFYRDMVGTRSTDDWTDLPILTKRDLQQPLLERLSKGFTRANTYVNKTSGSSGDPFIFAKDRFCHAMTWAVIQNRFSWHGIDFNTSLQARFYGIPLTTKGHLKEKLKDKLSMRRRFSVFDLGEQAFDDVVKEFNSRPFAYINGYTSAIVQFAKYLDEKEMVLQEVCPTLKCAIVTSEMLFESDKELMEKSFGVPVYNEYGASELDLIAFENPKKEWVLNTDTLFIEILDQNNRVVKDGEEGRIVISSLYNKAHPFIRYDIGDLGIVSIETIKGPATLKKLVGRSNDLIKLPSGKKAAGLTFYYITKQIIEDDGNVKEFVIEQLSLDTFKIIYTSSAILSRQKISQIIKEMANYLEPNLTIEFERRTIIYRQPSGKLKQFVSKI